MQAETDCSFRGLKAVITQRLPIIPTVATAYRDVLRVWLTMRTLVAVALLIILAIKVTEELIPLSLWTDSTFGLFLDLAAGAVLSFFLTPFMIAIHRFILLDEVTTGYVLDLRQPRFISYFGWLFALSVIGSLAFSLVEILPAIGVSAIPALALTFIVLIGVIIFSMRLAILFPAIAIDASGAGVTNALADSKGHGLQIFMIFLLALLPLLAFAIIITLILGPGVRNAGMLVAVVQLGAGVVIQTITAVLCLAIASRLFQALAGRVVHQTS